MMIEVGDWVYGKIDQLRVFGFVIQIQNYNRHALVHVTESELRGILHKEKWLPIDTLKKAEYDIMLTLSIRHTEGTILNMIDIALDERNEDDFKYWTNRYQQIKVKEETKTK